MAIQYLFRLAHTKPVAFLIDKTFHIFPSLAAFLMRHKETREALKKGLQLIDDGMELPDGASREGFIEANRELHMSLPEYLYQYNLYQKSKEERAEFLSYSDYHALVLKLRMKYPEYDNMVLLKDKEKFLRFATSIGLVHRRWLYAPETSFEEFADLIKSADCVIKPHDASWGNGIYMIDKQEGPQVKALYDKCVAKQSVVEERIKGYHITQAFHPSSLNTIRVTTMTFNGKVVIFAAMLRVGRGGTMVDNTHAGGLYAQIDPKTGIIESDGIDTEGKHFVNHPDTNLTFKGFQIPFWDRIAELCKNAALQTKNLFIGWDTAITEDGEIEVIEANSRPDFDGLQTPLHKGLRHKLFATLKELTGEEITL